jgi:hypothetical protein
MPKTVFHIINRSGVNQMWILKNSKDLLETISSRSVETNQHNPYPLEHQSGVATPFHQTGQIYCRLKNLTFE